MRMRLKRPPSCPPLAFAVDVAHCMGWTTQGKVLNRLAVALDSAPAEALGLRRGVHRTECRARGRTGRTPQENAEAGGGDEVGGAAPETRKEQQASQRKDPQPHVRHHKGGCNGTVTLRHRAC